MRTRLIHVTLAMVCLALLPQAGQVAELCDGPEDCSPTDACIGGACVPPVPDPDAYVTEAMQRWSSYLRAEQFPALFEPPENCCFDYTGDGLTDDAFGGLLGVLASTGLFPAGPHDLALAALESGELVKILDWRELAPDLASGDVQVSVFDGAWTDATLFPERVAGLGHVALLSWDFGPYGATDQLNAGTVTSGLIQVTGNQFTLSLPWLTGEMVPASLYQPRMEVPVTYSASLPAPCLGLCSVDEDRGAGHVPPIVGGAKLGGVIRAEEMFTHADDFYRECACAGIDPELPVIVWEENPGAGSFEISCTANTGDPDSCPSDSQCSKLGSLCNFIALGWTLDVDSDNTGIADSWSCGLRLGFSGTTLDRWSEVFADGFETGNVDNWSFSVP